MFYKLYKHFKLKVKSGKIAYYTLAALILSSVVYKLIDKLVDKILCYIFNLEPMNVMDEFFMYCKDGKPPNAGGLFRTNRFDFVKAKAQFV